ncbi:hypothetical protein [Myxococcus hansupus]|uniref:hypothetical protein n=1 Tax=Pseudomyxococcus hansupus TaxID=1297742 RepID=UPI0006769628|nr:hypothetical protein [Myxococcus hansupus]
MEPRQVFPWRRHQAGQPAEQLQCAQPRGTLNLAECPLAIADHLQAGFGVGELLSARGIRCDVAGELVVGDAKDAVRGDPPSVYEVNAAGEGDVACRQWRFTIQGLLNKQVGAGRACGI